MKYIKKFESVNAKMFDDYNDLFSHIEQYLKTIFINQPQSWNKKLSQIVDGKETFEHISFEIINLQKEVEKTKKTLEDFNEDINSHIRELDKIYSVSNILSDKDEKAYDLLDKFSSDIEKYLETIEEYIESLDKISRGYSTISDELHSITRLKFRLLI